MQQIVFVFFFFSWSLFLSLPRSFLTSADKENMFTLDHFPVWYRRAAEYPAGQFLYYMPRQETRGRGHTFTEQKKNTHGHTKHSWCCFISQQCSAGWAKKIFQWQAHFSILLQQLRSVYFVVNLCSDFIQHKFGKFCLSLFFTWVYILGVLLLWRVISSSRVTTLTVMSVCHLITLTLNSVFKFWQGMKVSNQMRFWAWPFSASWFNFLI